MCLLDVFAHCLLLSSSAFLSLPYILAPYICNSTELIGIKPSANLSSYFLTHWKLMKCYDYTVDNYMYSYSGLLLQQKLWMKQLFCSLNIICNFWK